LIYGQLLKNEKNVFIEKMQNVTFINIYEISDYLMLGIVWKLREEHPRVGFS
jgi:hypothetical protein